MELAWTGAGEPGQHVIMRPVTAALPMLNANASGLELGLDPVEAGMAAVSRAAG